MPSHDLSHLRMPQCLPYCSHGSAELATWCLLGCQYLVLCPHSSSESARWALQGCQYLVLCPHGSSGLVRWGLQGCQYLVLCPPSQVDGCPGDNASSGLEASINSPTQPGIFLAGPVTPVGVSSWGIYLNNSGHVQSHL